MNPDPRDGYANLMDLGIAVDVDSQTRSSPGQVLGTTHSVSPEQAMGHIVTPRSDLYSLGVLGHELTGVKPFDRGTPIATALAHVVDPPPPLPSDAPADLAEVIMACLAKDPDDRPESADEVAGLLAEMDEAATVSLVLADSDEKDAAADDISHTSGARSSSAPDTAS